ncbi:D-lactate ferricytochrome c oxidoreductase [Sporothrix eucalyptigena]|uniref:D-lactate ferricytochrome c oxidoreductase n=1 Tax=Sporothrix eucalyptigena TaxID=1812306 RepID=A0ABP0B6N6_9PEZI
MSFDEYIEKTVGNGELAGVALWAKDKNGNVIYDRALGVASLENPDESQRPPMTMDTVVRLASSSKLVTTIAALQAVEQGLIGLDDDVAEHIPEFASLEVLEGFTWYGKPLTRPRNPAATITLRSLLNQTSGAGYDFLKWQPLWRVRWWRSEKVAGGSSLEERLAHPLLHDPGDGWTYGSGVTWAGRVVERVAGCSLEEWMTRNISKPLGLTCLTFFPQRNPELAAHLAGMSNRSPWSGKLAYFPDTPVQEKNELGEDVCMGGEGVHCTVADFCKIIYSLLVDDGKLLKPSTTAAMFSKQLTSSQRPPLEECLDLRVWICRSVLNKGEHDWGLGGVLIDGTTKTGLQDGALMWSGLYHVLWWVDRKAGVCGFFATQLMPAVDKVGVPSIVAFQKEVYRRMGYNVEPKASLGSIAEEPEEKNRGAAIVVLAYVIGRKSGSSKKKSLAPEPVEKPSPPKQDDDEQPLFTSTRSTLPLNRVVEAKHNTSPENMAAARAEIIQIVGEKAVTDHRDELSRHTSSSWSSYAESADDNPHFVVYPQSTEDVSAIMRICHRRRVPVVAFGGGTSLEGHFANVCRGISIDLSRMDRILTVHGADFDAVVQPGVGYEQLNEALADRRLFFPPDPGPGATIGGMVGTGCSGTNAYYYGTMREWVLGLTVVLADGTVVQTRRRPRKSSAGYDLTKLFIGNEGTLGIVTEATLKLTSKPAYEQVTVATFDNFHEACDTVIKLVSAGIHVAAVELIGSRAMRWINDSAGTDRTWPEKPTLFLKFAGSTEKAVGEQAKVVEEIAKTAGATALDTARNQEESEQLWEARKQALFTAAGSKADDESSWITDVAVPISRLADIVDLTSKDIVASGISGGIIGHVGDGNFHCFLFYNPRQKEKAEELVHRMVERAINMEGTVTGEHGVGLVKRDYLAKEIGENAVDLMRQIKNAFDPLCLLNCDKVVRMKPSLVNSTR